MTNAGNIRNTKSLQYLTWSYWLGEPEYISDVVKHLDRHTLSRNNPNKHFKKRYKIPAEVQVNIQDTCTGTKHLHREYFYFQE